MAVFNNILAGAAGQTGGAAAPTIYQIDRSLRFNSADSVSLTKSFSSNGDRQKWTLSFWIKRSKLGTKQQILGTQGTNDSDYAEMYFDTDDKLFIRFGYTSVVDAKPAAVFRDLTAWYHIVIALDTQNSTANHRLRVYVNGTELDDYSDDSRSSFTGTYGIGRAGAHKISGEPNSSGSEIDGYLAEIHYVNGSQLAWSDFAAVDSDNNLNPKEYSGTYGTNGFYLKFADNTSNASLGTDSSGNNNTFTVTNFLATAGSDGAAGFAAVTYSGNGGTQVIGGPVYSDGWSGSVDSTNGAGASFDGTSGTYTRSGVNASCTWTAPSSISFTTLKIRGARDSGNGTIEVNGVDVSSQFTSSSATLNTQTITGVTSPLTSIKLTGNASSQPRVAFVEIDGTVLKDGTGVPLKFQPDFVWIKNRDSSSYGHRLVDSVRGSTKYLMSHNNGAEATDSNGVTSFNSSGFTVGSSNDYNVSGNNNDFIAWAWKAGGTAVSKNSGSIPATVSANDAYGFSIVKYEGTGVNGTVAHGLNTAPKFFFGRNLEDNTGSRDWIVYHESLGNTKRLKFTSGNTSTSSTFFQNTSPSNSVITIGTSDDINKDNDDYILYCWSEVSGFSKFGSYTGSSNAQTITTGFKPAFVILRDTTQAANWVLLDSKRGSSWLEADGAAADNSNNSHQITYNDDGFTVSGDKFNVDGKLMIYIAFADTPDTSNVDSLIDTPTNADADSGNNIGNYCTLNPLAKGSAMTHSNGNLNFSAANSGSQRSWGTIGVSSGKWYFEYTQNNGSAQAIGIKSSFDQNNSDGYFYTSGSKIDFSGSSSSYGATWAENDVIGVAFDLDNSSITFYKNGVSQGTAFSSITDATYFPFVLGWAGGTFDGVLNFGASGFFKYAIPAGYKALCTQNLDPPTIADGSKVFDVKTYNGTGNTNAQTLNFSPDLLWIKRRNGTNAHALFDQIRGVTKALESSNNGVEKTNDPAISSFDANGSNGFTVNGTYNQTNASGGTYVGWAWDAGTTTDTNNTDGSITSSVRANTSSGFSIVTWTGTNSNATVGHGLNAAPGLIIAKARNEATFWPVYHSALGRGNYSGLDDDWTFDSTYSDYWGNAEPTTSVFGVKGNAGNNRNGKNMLAYCFAPVAGYSAFGSYKGTGYSDNRSPFLYLGFKPAFVMIKSTTLAHNWVIFDSTRGAYNVVDEILWANKPNAENTIDTDDTNTGDLDFDILSNGIKFRTANWSVNKGASDTYIYAAFAEHPFKTARAR